MKINAIYLLLFGFLFSSRVFSVELKIKLFYGKELTSVSIKKAADEFLFYSDSNLLSVPDSLVKFSVFKSADSIILKSGTNKLFTCKLLRIVYKSGSPLTIDAVANKKVVTRTYDGELQLAVFNGQLVCVNKIGIEQYVPGVIQAEVGKGNLLEFNKVKAIIIRTYALSNIRKHELEGAHLCDDVHCQVYRGKSVVQNILFAVKQTESMVLVDTSLQLVNAAFHANCGGHTCNSEDVWQKKLNYLRGVPDSFCTKLPDHYWSKKITKTEWLNYFNVKYKIQLTDSASKPLLAFTQTTRKVYFLSSPSVQLKTLREDWKLRSTWFEVTSDETYVLLSGKGFGHGVGLCQQGAMQMSKKGYTSRQIIDYYFMGVVLINYNQLNFFGDN